MSAFARAARLLVISAGVATTFQDRGRPGWAHVGVPPSGAIDPAAMAAVNRAVGNPPDAVVLETAGGLTLEAVEPSVVASSDAVGPTVLVHGERYHVRPDADRQWQYVAVQGGFEVAATLGSASTDTLTGLGPPPVRDGLSIPIGGRPAAAATDLLVRRELPDRLRVSPGPRLGWFADEAWRLLVDDVWTVAMVSRVGVRLTGPTISRRERGELPSEGLVRGAVQVPHDGAPVVMSADHPTTGGYPVIAVVHEADLPALLQRSVGQIVRFVPIVSRTR